MLISQNEHNGLVGAWQYPLPTVLAVGAIFRHPSSPRLVLCDLASDAPSSAEYVQSGAVPGIASSWATKRRVEFAITDGAPMPRVQKDPKEEMASPLDMRRSKTELRIGRRRQGAN